MSQNIMQKTRVWHNPTFVLLRERLAQAPLLAYLVGILAGVALERMIGLLVGRLLGIGRIPVLLGLLDIFEAFKGLDLTGILGPLFPASSEVSAQPWTDAGLALINVILTILGNIPTALITIIQVTLYNLIIFGLPTMVLAILLTSVTNQLLTRIPRRLNQLLALLLLYAIIWVWGGENAYR